MTTNGVTPTAAAAPLNRRLALAQPAVRAGQKARIALSGPSGAGKTWTALSISRYLRDDPSGKVLLIDTEEGSGALYADEFPGLKYDHLRWLPPYDPRELTETLAGAGREYAVVIVDSLSHFWDDEGGTLDIVDSVAQRSPSGNSFAAWKQGTPIQKDMVRAFLRCGAHVLITMRSKTEYVIEETVSSNGRKSSTPKRIGVTPVQRAGLEYEFTFLCSLGLDHQLVVDKSRFAEVADKRYLPKKEVEFAKAIKAWLDGAAVEVQPTAPATGEIGDIELVVRLGAELPKTPKTRPQVEGMLAEYGYAALLQSIKNQHKMQCGSACPHFEKEPAPPATPEATG